MTEQSRAATEAMRLAKESAARGRRENPSTADLVSGVINLDRGIGARALTHLGLTREEVVRHLDAAPPEAAYRLQTALGFMRRFAGTTKVTTGHILVGALSDPASAAAQALVSMGVKVDEVRTEVEDLFTSGIEDDTLPQRQIPLAMTPSADHHGVVLPWAMTLAENAAAHVRFDTCVAYPTGFEFRISLKVAPKQRLAPDPWRHDDDGLFIRIEAVPGTQYEIIRRPRLRAGPIAALFITGGPPLEMLELSAARRADFMLWAWPLPPAQMLDIVCAWPKFDLAEIHTRVDGAEILSAARIALPIWETPR